MNLLNIRTYITEKFQHFSKEEIFFQVIPLIIINILIILMDVNFLIMCVYGIFFIILRPLIHKIIDYKDQIHIGPIKNRTISIIAVLFFLFYYEVFSIIRFFANQKEVNLQIFAIENLYFFQDYALGIFSTLLLTASSLFIGTLFLRKTQIVNNFNSIYEELLIKIAGGISINIFIFSWILQLLPQPLFIICGYLILTTGVFLLSDHLPKLFWNFIKHWLIDKSSINIKRENIIPILSMILFVATFLIIINRTFSFGTDALRTYLHIPSYIGETQQLPTKYFNTFYPFIFEIFLSPAFFLGGVAGGHIALYLMSLFYLLIVPALLNNDKKYTKLQIFKITAIILTFNPFLNFFFYQYKIDILVCLIFFALYVSFEKFIKNADLRIKLVPIISLLSSTLFIAKLNYILFIIPIGLILIIFLIKDIKKFTHSILISGIIIISAFSFWIFIYSRDVPYTQFLNNKIMTIIPNTIAASHNKISACYDDMLKFEQDEFYKPNAFKFFKRFNFSITLTKISIIFTNIFIVLIYTIYKYRKTFINNISKTDYLVLSPLIFSFILNFYSNPYIMWYVAPQLIIITILILKKLVENKFIDLAYKFYFPLYMYLFVTYSVVIFYFSSLRVKEDYLNYYVNREDQHPFQYDNEIIASKLNAEPNAKVLYFSGATFLNMTYFINNYFSRVYYADYLNTDLAESIKRYDIDFIVENKYENILRPDQCIAKNIDDLRQQLNEIERSHPGAVERLSQSERYNLYRIKKEDL